MSPLPPRTPFSLTDSFLTDKAMKNHSPEKMDGVHPFGVPAAQPLRQMPPRSGKNCYHLFKTLQKNFLEDNDWYRQTSNGQTPPLESEQAPDSISTLQDGVDIASISSAASTSLTLCAKDRDTSSSIEREQTIEGQNSLNTKKNPPHQAEKIPAKPTATVLKTSPPKTPPAIPNKESACCIIC